TRRVTRAIVDAEVPAPMQSDAHYSYDKSGNVTSIADTPTGKASDVQCFTLDYQQRITEAWTPAGGCDQAPSVAGLSGPAPYWQSWDGEGRLAKVQQGSDVTEFVYDADGSRLIRRDPSGSTLFLDGQELQLSKAGTATTTRYYQYGGSTVAMRDHNGLTWLASDH